MAIVEHVLCLVYLISLALAYRLSQNNFRIPFVATTFPLFLILIFRFIWHKSILKAFRTPYHLVKFLVNLLFVNLIINLSLSYDNFFVFDSVALLWPCYGFLALTFIFFIATLLLFLGSACSSFSREESIGFELDDKKDITFTCGISSLLLLHASHYLTSSVLGFMILLQQVKDGLLFDQGYYILITMPLISAGYTLC